MWQNNVEDDCSTKSENQTSGDPDLYGDDNSPIGGKQFALKWWPSSIRVWISPPASCAPPRDVPVHKILMDTCCNKSVFVPATLLWRPRFSTKRSQLPPYIVQLKSFLVKKKTHWHAGQPSTAGSRNMKTPPRGSDYYTKLGLSLIRTPTPLS